MKLATSFIYLKCRIQGVSLGRQCKFYGLASFFVENGGNIRIGNNCKFRSRTLSNKIGLNHRCIISVSAQSHDGATLSIGNDCGFSGTSIRCFTCIRIGNNVRIGANSLIMDGDGHFNDRRTAPPKPIIIEDGVFIGANVVVKKGVTIGKNSVIGMNSVVTKSIPANCVAVGIPCKVIRTL